MSDKNKKIKYATKPVDFFGELNKWQAEKPISRCDLKPLAVELEITNRCNLQCPHCGMGANLVVGKNRFTEKECLKLVDDLYDFGVPALSITGGEPFLEFNNLCEMIAHAQGKVDFCKFCTNGFWGDNAKEYFDKLIACGLLNNRFFVPTFLLSIGEQTINLETIANLAHYIVSNFKPTELQVGITSVRMYKAPSKVKDFITVYKNKFGKYPQDIIHLTNYYYTNSYATFEKLNLPKDTIWNCLDMRENCFKTIIHDEIMPKLMLKCSGNVMPCGCLFNQFEQLKLGNYFELGFAKIIENFNANPYIRFINEKGFNGFKEVIPEYILDDYLADDFCYACKFCLDYCQKEGVFDE